MYKRAAIVLGCVSSFSGCPVTPLAPTPHTCAPRVIAPRDDGGAAGTLQVLAGEGGPGYADGLFARTNGVGGLARVVDGVVVSDVFNGTLRGLDVDAGTMTTRIGVPLDIGAVDGGCGDARLNGPRGVVADPRDPAIVIFGDGPCLRRADLVAGIVNTIAGDCTAPGNDDDTLAAARFGFLLHDLEIDDDGRIYVADRANDAIRVVDVEGGYTVSLASGLHGPGGLALDGPLLFVADTFDHTIKSVDTKTGELRIVAGRSGEAGSVDGDLATATLDSPQALALIGRVLMTAGFDGAVRAIDLDVGTVATIAYGRGFFASFLAEPDGVLAADLDGAVVRITLQGTITHVAGPRSPTGAVDGPGVTARFALPACVVVDGDAALVSDAVNSSIRRVELESGLTTTFVGQADSPGNDDGPRAAARLEYPAGLALADDGDVFIVDNAAGTLRRLDRETDTVSTIARDLTDPWEVDVVDTDHVAVVEAAAGRVSLVRVADGAISTLADGLAFPVGLAVIDARIFVTENEGHTLLEIGADGSVTRRLGTPGFQGSVDGAADVALLNFPAGLASGRVFGRSTLFIAETGGQTIRRVDIASFESRFVVGDPVLSGALSAGSRVSLTGAPLLNPNDTAIASTLADEALVIVGDTTVLVARPSPGARSGVR
jgi:sugar lactone lactonase YvrE